MMFSVHYDRQLNYRPDGPIPGFLSGTTQGLADRLAGCCPDHKHQVARTGYLSALCILRSNAMPGAFERHVHVARLQEAIDRAIQAIKHADVVMDSVVDGLADDLKL